jgi:hypothetical protein
MVDYMREGDQQRAESHRRRFQARSVIRQQSYSDDQARAERE